MPSILLFRMKKSQMNCLNAVRDENDQLNNEVVQIQQSYHLTENEFETQMQLENELSSLYKRFEILCEKVKNNETASNSG